MKKIEIDKLKHYLTTYILSGWIAIDNIIFKETMNILIVVKYQKEHLPLKYR